LLQTFINSIQPICIGTYIFAILNSKSSNFLHLTQSQFSCHIWAWSTGKVWQVLVSFVQSLTCSESCFLVLRPM